MTHRKVEPPRLLTLPSVWHPFKRREVLEYNGREMRRVEREYVRLVNEYEIRARELSESGQFVKAGAELDEAAELMRKAHESFPGRRYEEKMNALKHAAEEKYRLESSVRGTPEISEMRADHNERWGKGVAQYYKGEARQLREREESDKEFRALMDIYRMERGILENRGTVDAKTIWGMFCTILELLPRAALGLEREHVELLKQDIQNLAADVYRNGPAAQQINEKTKRVTHCKVMTAGERKRKARREGDISSWARDVYLS